MQPNGHYINANNFVISSLRIEMHSQKKKRKKKVFSTYKNNEYQRADQTKYLLNHNKDLGNMIRYTRLHRRRKAMKILHIPMKLFTITSAQINWILPQLISSFNNLQNSKIVDSGILSYICNKQLVLHSWHLSH